MGKVKEHTQENEAFDFFARTDFTELRNQKRTLLETINFIENSTDFDPRVDKDEIVENLTGLLHLIDAFQDTAVDKLELVDPMMVYDFEDEENRED